MVLKSSRSFCLNDSGFSWQFEVSSEYVRLPPRPSSWLKVIRLLNWIWINAPWKYHTFSLRLVEVLVFQDFSLVTLLALHSLYGLQKYYLSDVDRFWFTGVSRINFGTGRVWAADELSLLSRVSSFILWFFYGLTLALFSLIFTKQVFVLSPQI